MSAIDVSEELLADVKNFLDVTWSDPKSDAKLRGQIRHGISYLVDKTGVAPSAFSGEDANDRAQKLLFYLVLYDRAGAFSQFVQNYSFEINSLRRSTRVHAAKASGEAAQ